jgi:hypothetical protein
MGAAIVSNERVRAYRERRRAGLIQLTIEIDEIALPEKLCEAGLLSPARIDNRDAIIRAVEKLIAMFLGSHQ